MVFTRCSVCGGWGKDLVNSSGKCDYCERGRDLVQSKSGSDPSTQASQQTASSQSIYSSQQIPPSQIHSRASEVYGMQPQLRMYKKRPGCVGSLLS